MNISYFHRNPYNGYSMRKIFNLIISEISKSENVREFFVPSHRALPIDMIRNCYYAYKRKEKKGINHITGQIHYLVLSFLGYKSILTIHDLDFLVYAKNNKLVYL